ncbi:MAG: stage III sporulation protein AG [bacterium]|nr:stage III sporulation protein AG [bacterium]
MSFRETIPALKQKFRTMKKDQYLILILTGVLLLVIVFPTGSKEEDAAAAKSAETHTTDNNLTEVSEETLGMQAGSEEAYISMLEEKLERGISYIAGAGRVKVMITLNAGTEQVVLKDTSDQGASTIEKDASGGNRTVMENETAETTIYVEEENGTRIPYVCKNLPPQIEGVTVICEGGDNSVVRSDITGVVKALFPVEAHKIKVVRMAVTKTNSGKETIER